MNTATVNPNTTLTTTHDGSIFRRFVWKEFRMLRGLWLAVAIIGFVVQCTLKWLLPPGSDYSTIMFSTALASAVLFAAGAAATTFSVEHEEETYDFLSRLPTTWWPVFAGKLLVNAVGAVLLALSLSVAGAIVSGHAGSARANTSEIVGVLGVGILKALAWGTLFSLIIRRPLVAAILTLVVGDIVVNIAVNVSTARSAASANAEGYVDAISPRMAIVLAVLVCSAIIARRWLAGAPRSRA